MFFTLDSMLLEVRYFSRRRWKNNNLSKELLRFWVSWLIQLAKSSRSSRYLYILLNETYFWFWRTIRTRWRNSRSSIMYSMRWSQSSKICKWLWTNGEWFELKGKSFIIRAGEEGEVGVLIVLRSFHFRSLLSTLPCPFREFNSLEFELFPFEVGLKLVEFEWINLV
jgi:hypothetical protein